MYFGKIKNTEDEWGFSTSKENLDKYGEVDGKTHMEFIERANKEQKKLSGDKDGFPILVDYPPPTNEVRIQELQNYLDSTDWYAIRFADTGEPIPEDIKNKRQQAREGISVLREKVSL